MEKFKKLDREHIYEGRRINVYKQMMLTTDNKEIDWDIVEHNGGSAVLAVDDDGKILIVKQYRATCDDFTLEIPAGALDSPDEDPFYAGKRELREETGYISEDFTFLCRFYSSIGIFDEIINIYLAKELIETEQDLDEHEEVEIYRYTLEELISMIFTGEIIDAKTILAILMYKESLRRDDGRE